MLYLSQDRTEFIVSPMEMSLHRDINANFTVVVWEINVHWRRNYNNQSFLYIYVCVYIYASFFLLIIFIKNTYLYTPMRDEDVVDEYYIRTGSASTDNVQIHFLLNVDVMECKKKIYIRLGRANRYMIFLSRKNDDAATEDRCR